LLFREDQTLVDMHYALQIVFNWTDFYLHPFHLLSRLREIVEEAEDDTDCGEWIRDEFPDLAYWLTYSKFDRRQANRRLKQYAVGDKQWREGLWILEGKVDIRTQVTIEHENAQHVEMIAVFRRAELQPETLGLTLAEAQDLLASLQYLVVSQQVSEYNEQQCFCPDCGTKRSRKDSKQITYRTAFGKFKLGSPRFYTCDCHPRPERSESPLARLLSERTSPELLYLQTKWASLMSYGMTTDLLKDVLPIDMCDSSIRHNVQ
jgi:hypothetical protein